MDGTISKIILGGPRLKNGNGGIVPLLRFCPEIRENFKKTEGLLFFARKPQFVGEKRWQALGPASGQRQR